MGKKPGRLAKTVKALIVKAKRLYAYFTDGIWTTTRRNWRIDFLRTVSLSIRSFLDSGLQMRAMALTYQTMLAIVPALALIFAIGRGFGLQDVIQRELVEAFPAQRQLMKQAFGFVDSYLEQSSEGIFVGVGILFLLWTLISLLGAVENSFNTIWAVQQGRSFWRKITDYTAIFLILPILMICSSGLSLLMSTALHTLLPFDFMSTAITWILDLASLIFTWLFFAGAYMLIPNAKVKFPNALLAGALAGSAFLIVQWLFVTGQMYVTRYNAIYGSFSLLPLLLIWTQLAWLICLSGAVVCYSSQNIYEFSFNSQIDKISLDYRNKLTLAVLVVVVKRFVEGGRPYTDHDFAAKFGLPSRIVSDITGVLQDCNLLIRVVLDDKDQEYGYQPAIDPSQITLGLTLSRLAHRGKSGFVPQFRHRFSSLIDTVDSIKKEEYASADTILLRDIPLDQ